MSACALPVLALPTLLPRRSLGFHGSHAASPRKLKSLGVAESVEVHRIRFVQPARGIGSGLAVSEDESVKWFISGDGLRFTVRVPSSACPPDEGRK